MYAPRRMLVELPTFAMTGRAFSLHYQLREGFDVAEVQGAIDAPDYIATGSLVGDGWVQWASIPRPGGWVS